jgi:hypothetical protein
VGERELGRCLGDGLADGWAELGRATRWTEKKRKRKEGSWGLVREIERKRGSEGWFWDFELLFENYNTHSNKTNAKSCMHSNT